jgi:hypothetical protein
MTEINNQSQVMKICHGCGKNLPIESFRAKTKANGKIVYHSPCKECKKESDKKSYQKHAEKRKAYGRARKAEKSAIKKAANQAILDAGGVIGSFKRVGLDHINEFVKEKHEGKCLSTIYKNGKQNLLFECKWGHQWLAMWTNIQKGKWCPSCASLSGERITRLYFETIFDKSFPKERPSWLLGEKGYRMELDGYCAELGVAFEHHGMQHYFISEFHKTQEELDKRQNDDKLKQRLCNKNGVKLIIVPQVPNLTPLDNLIPFIYDQCKMLNISILKSIHDITIMPELEPISFEYLKRYQKIAEERDGQCISEVYVNCHTRLKFKCNKDGHIWEAFPGNILKGFWCHQCTIRNKADKVVK